LPQIIHQIFKGMIVKEKPISWWPPGGGFLILGPGPARVISWPFTDRQKMHQSNHQVLETKNKNNDRFFSPTSQTSLG
jgi:hypothetical protein